MNKVVNNRAGCRSSQCAVSGVVASNKLDGIVPQRRSIDVRASGGNKVSAAKTTMQIAINVIVAHGSAGLRRCSRRTNTPSP